MKMGVNGGPALQLYPLEPTTQQISRSRLHGNLARVPPQPVGLGIFECRQLECALSEPRITAETGRDLVRAAVGWPDPLIGTVAAILKAAVARKVRAAGQKLPVTLDDRGGIELRPLAEADLEQSLG